MSSEARNLERGKVTVLVTVSPPEAADFMLEDGTPVQRHDADCNVARGFKSCTCEPVNGWGRFRG